MSDTVSFDDETVFPARAATIETIFDSLREHAPEHPEFWALIARRDEFDRLGAWSFDDLSPDAFRLLARILDRMAEDLPAVADRAGWNESRKPVFYADVERFRARLADRIARTG